MYGRNIMWFTRAGWSDGWHADRAAAIGAGWRPTENYNDLFGIGLGWAQPANSLLRDRYTSEVFYRFQITPNLALTPDLQYIVDPSFNPNQNSIWVVSLRTRITF